MFNLSDGYHALPAGKLINLVTCLDMVAPPGGLVRGFPAGVRLERLSGQEVQRHRKLFAAVGDDWLWFSRQLKSDMDIAEILDSPAIESYALTQDGADLGMLELNFSEAGVCELAYFGLVASAIGTGLGRALMAEALARAWEKPITRLWVHTCSFDHPGALSFYIKSGFRPYQLMMEVHDDPRIAGHLPVTAAPHVPLIRP